MKFPHSFRAKACVLGALLINIVFLSRYFHARITRFWTRDAKQPDYSAREETHGFETILVVAPNEASEQLHWRRDDLLQAASYTGLNLDISHQPHWTDVDIGKLMGKNKEMGKGYALSWLGHLNALREAATRRTSLILEDDVDWDIGILTQIPLVVKVTEVKILTS
ncbi:glycosyltransferase family 25 protein [Melanomma pulvis-pyrius CBS 109.77]|uniref:Glycosyltransferase family 25 protein n=1 Tax=Melanomma pulvis-pyrius CBS 109.77 TaxID=1314802 RepID=A0A6A6XNH3_9PLEO|nr:glycosyltransferase family 25 protein [Melanomma pulvis-pyrius CBS 109.77]